MGALGGACKSCQCCPTTPQSKGMARRLRYEVSATASVSAVAKKHITVHITCMRSICWVLICSRDSQDSRANPP